MRIIYLIPPSEGKNTGGNYESEQLSFIFDKPSQIVKNVTEKDLHCKEKRFLEAGDLNKKTLNNSSQYMQAIHRYSGVMFNAIDYNGMSSQGKKYFEEKFLIVSGMYGLVRPKDIIGNYKLPIGAKGLYTFWGEILTQTIQDLQADVIVNLLPQAYAKAIDFDSLDAKVIDVVFLKYKGDDLVNMAHGVKKVKGEWIKNVCEKIVADYTHFQGDLDQDNTKISLKIIQQ